MNSKLFPNHRWLVCAPNYYDVRYQINPWMDVSRAPHHTRASDQWTMLHHTLIRLGAWLEYVTQGQGLPDMVFTANGGLLRDGKVVLPRFRPIERQGEEPLFKRWFEENNYKIHEVTSGSFEGEGDALFAGEILFGGHGFRSDACVYDEIGEFLNIKKVVLVELIDPRFYHLDTCFCPISHDKALLNPAAFKPETVKEINKHLEIIAVPEGDAAKFACNAVVLGKSIVMPAGCNETARILEPYG